MMLPKVRRKHHVAMSASGVPGETSMISLTHHSTLHLFSKIKCCDDRLRPPGKSGH
jgi:hypothetical protein